MCKKQKCQFDIYVYVYMIKIIHNEHIRKLVYVRRGMATGHKDKGNE